MLNPSSCISRFQSSDMQLTSPRTGCKCDCTQNSNFWKLIYRLKKTNPGKKIILTSRQRFALCNYMNGKPFNREILKEFIL